MTQPTEGRPQPEPWTDWFGRHKVWTIVLGAAAFLLLVGLFVPNLGSNSNSGNVQTADGPADPPPPLHEDPPPGE